MTSPKIVISEWLKLCRAGQWTPFEAAEKIVERLNAAGYVIVPKEPTPDMVDAGLIPTASWIDVKGSALTVNREKMRRRYRAMIESVNRATDKEIDAAIAGCDHQ